MGKLAAAPSRAEHFRKSLRVFTGGMGEKETKYFQTSYHDFMEKATPIVPYEMPLYERLRAYHWIRLIQSIKMKVTASITTAIAVAAGVLN